MESLYNVNGLVFWNEEQILLRKMMAEYFRFSLQSTLQKINPQFSFHECEAPLLTPDALLNSNYTDEDVWRQGAGLTLRPETTPGSYVYAQYLLNNHLGVKPPLMVWQTGKSFRREQDQVTKNMRLKEFYQQEFQCIYTADTANDYHAAVLEPVRKMLTNMIGFPSRLVTSDRLPSYSQITMDVEVNNGDKWMEVCSISRRTDFPQKLQFTNKKQEIVEKDAFVLEIAIGLDRCVYNFEKRTS